MKQSIDKGEKGGCLAMIVLLFILLSLAKMDVLMDSVEKKYIQPNPNKIEQEMHR